MSKPQNVRNTRISIWPIPAFVDNYFWLLERSGQAVVVDP